MLRLIRTFSLEEGYWYLRKNIIYIKHSYGKIFSADTLELIETYSSRASIISECDNIFIRDKYQDDVYDQKTRTFVKAEFSHRPYIVKDGNLIVNGINTGIRAKNCIKTKDFITFLNDDYTLSSIDEYGNLDSYNIIPYIWIKDNIIITKGNKIYDLSKKEEVGKSDISFTKRLSDILFVDDRNNIITLDGNILLQDTKSESFYGDRLYIIKKNILYIYQVCKMPIIQRAFDTHFCFAAF